MKDRKELPNLSLIREMLDYRPDTGKFTWKPRPEAMFTRKRLCVTWNKRFAGKEALCTKHHAGYLYGAILESNYSAHRMAWYITHGEVPDEVDHIDGDRSNNKIDNLRNVSRQENCKNSARQRRYGMSGAMGVSWDAENSKWHVRVGRKHIGRYASFEAAVEARKAAAAAMGYHVNHGREAN